MQCGYVRAGIPDANRACDRGNRTCRAISDIVPFVQTLVAEILAAWRRADRLASEYAEGSPEHAAAQVACERLRDLYRDLTSSGVADALSEADARQLLTDLAAGQASGEA